MSAATHIPDPVVLDGLREAWSAGYQSAVDALREMADEFGDETANVIRATAITLQEMKP